LALPSSQVTPVDTCPGLRPRWCPDYSPLRSPDCCLPPHQQRRLSPVISRLSQCPQLYIFQGSMSHVSLSKIPIYRGILDPPSFVLPLPEWHMRFTIILLARLWISRTYTYWVTRSNFNEHFTHFPMIWVYLGTMMRLLETEIPQTLRNYHFHI